MKKPRVTRVFSFIHRYYFYTARRVDYNTDSYISVVPKKWGQPRNEMHKNTKLTPVLRKEIFMLWKEHQYSLRTLGAMYHVDKRVIGRIVERGKTGDFSVHDSTNRRYERAPAKKSRAGSSSPARATKKR